MSELGVESVVVVDVEGGARRGGNLQRYLIKLPNSIDWA